MKQENQQQIAKAREILKTLKASRNVIPFHRKLANDPALIHAFTQQHINCNQADVTIPRKYRELMLMMLGCVKNLNSTIITHGKLAYEHGASIEEIGEVLRLVFYFCGVSAIIPAEELFEALEDLDE